ncbi:MAG: DUF3784 domain-containing protein [Turicibacter sp.]|nr:DUF3784 domain-containing protein [Turicibacter sp.]
MISLISKNIHSYNKIKEESIWKIYSKKERLKYDEKRLSLDMRNNFITYGIIFVIGSIPTYFFGMWCFILTIIIWLIYFFKNVHLDDEKYKK